MVTPYDPHHSHYYHSINFAGPHEMPLLNGTDLVPSSIIRFSDAKSKKSDAPDAWIIPYEDDAKIEPMWRNANRYLDHLLQHPGIVSWDFSMYRNMPYATAHWNCFRGRLIGAMYEREGGVCIPNIRPCDSRSLQYVFDGVPTESTIAMGTLGAIRRPDDRAAFARCVSEAVHRLHPKNIVVYGSAPDDIFYSAYESGTKIYTFTSAIAIAHSRGRTS